MIRSKKRVAELLAPAVWDYAISPWEFYQIALGKAPARGFLNQTKALQRILERIGWYEILELFGITFLKRHLTPEVTTGLRFQDMRETYERIRKVLQGEPVSFPEWSDETRRRARNAVLSNRWYGVEPSLF